MKDDVQVKAGSRLISLSIVAGVVALLTLALLFIHGTATGSREFQRNHPTPPNRKWNPNPPGIGSQTPAVEGTLGNDTLTFWLVNDSPQFHTLFDMERDYVHVSSPFLDQKVYVREFLETPHLEPGERSPKHALRSRQVEDSDRGVVTFHGFGNSVGAAVTIEAISSVEIGRDAASLEVLSERPEVPSEDTGSPDSQTSR